VARQRLGQHFLGDGAWREKIARAVIQTPAEDSDGDSVWIEIGAGHGEMTALLARNASHVIAIEMDRRLLPGLRALASRLGNVTVAAGDVLSMDLGKLAGGRDYRVYGSIPYYITSPIVHHLFASKALPESAFLVMQLEVAERLAARPGGREYGYLSAFTQFYARSEIVLRIPPGAFRPPPQVDSALIALRLPGERESLDVRDDAGFAEFLKLCFSQKRKTLRNNLRGAMANSRPEFLLEQSGIRGDARAEQLSLADMARLFARIQKG
jgi:16S rRNA (adenine1518-N6/adenine1519-N6)-dimethyltransferase